MTKPVLTSAESHPAFTRCVPIEWRNAWTIAIGPGKAAAMVYTRCPRTLPLRRHHLQHRPPECLQLCVADAVDPAQVEQGGWAGAGHLAQRAVAEDDVGGDAALLRLGAAP